MANATSRAVLITGCSTGIGRATAEHLAARGWTVYASARRLDAIQDLGSRGCKLLALDVCDEDSIRAAVAAVEGAEGAVGVLINNAGYGQEGVVEEVSMAEVRRQFETNFFGLTRLTQLVLPRMRRQGWGKIVNVSSVGGKLTLPGGGFYHATKHAVEALSDALRFEVRQFGIDVVVIEPGPIKTRFGDTAIGSIGRLGEAGSPYAAFNAVLAAKIRDAYEGSLGRLAAGPEAVARVIERALTANRPRTRYPVTGAARVMLFLRRWPPTAPSTASCARSSAAHSGNGGAGGRSGRVLMALDAGEHKLAAIFSADVVGYSRLMALDEAATVRTVNAYREQMAVLIRQYRGRVVDSRGDNLLAEFPSALDAVCCAVETQRVLRARNTDQPVDRKMEFRIGIHLGDVMVRGDEIYGDGVNIAARVQALAEPGGVCLSGAVHEQVRDKLPVSFEDAGEQAIKNIPHPVRVYRTREAAPRSNVVTLADLAGRRDIAIFVVPAAWVLYVAIVFEILFMISPFGLYYYSVYGPSLSLPNRSPWTAWLTHFFLPHFSHTSSPVLNALEGLGGFLMLVGGAGFLVAFGQIYWAKFRQQGLVTGGLYAVARHPQYVALAILGLGTLLVWPRYLVLIMYVTMLFLYVLLARWEEHGAAEQFGGYRAYRERTGRFWPRRARLRPASGGRTVAMALALYVLVMAGALALAHQAREYSLSRVSSLYTETMAVLSPAVLTAGELGRALGVAMADDNVKNSLPGAGSTAKLLVYVVPVEWRLPDLPLERDSVGGHYTPRDFDRRLYKLLFTTVRAHDPTITGRDIVAKAYGLDPIVVARVNTESGQVTAIETPPEHVRWGDIPTPLF